MNDTPRQSKRPWTRLNKSDYVLDTLTAADVSCVTNDWAASESIEATPIGVSNEDQKNGIRDRISRLLQSKKGACVRPTESYCARMNLPYDSTAMFGWVVFGWDSPTHMPAIYFCYVKGAFRKNGLARLLIQSAAGVEPGTVAWATSMRRWLVPSAEKHGLIPNPYILERR